MAVEMVDIIFVLLNNFVLSLQERLRELPKAICAKCCV